MRSWRAAGALLAPLLLAGCHGPAPRSPFATADSLRLEGRSAQAVGLFHALRDSFAHTDDTTSLWRAQTYWGDALFRLGKRDSARVVLDEALRLAGTNPDREGWTRLTIEKMLDRQGRFPEAMVQADSALVLARQAHDTLLIGWGYNSAGRIYSLTGRHRLALAAHEQELAFHRRAPPATLANALNELGIDYRHLGRFSESVDVYEQSVAIYRRLRNPEGTARSLMNLANVRLELGDEGVAERLMTEALGLVEQIGDPRGLEQLHNSLGDVYLKVGNLAAARQHYLLADSISGALHYAYGLVSGLEGLGRLALAEGHADAAMPFLREGVALADSQQFGTQRAMIRAGLARAEAARRHGAAARRWASEARIIADSLEDPEVQFEALSAQGVALEVSDAGAALDSYGRAIALLESVRGRMALGDLRMGVAALHLDVYEAAIRILVAQGQGAEAFTVAERARARLLLALLAEGEVAKTARSKVDSFRQTVREQYEALSSSTEALRPALDASVRLLSDSLTALERVGAAVDPVAQVRTPRPASLEEVETGLLGRDRALVSFFWGEHQVYGWWVTADGVHAAALGDADSLASLVEFLRGALERPAPDLDWRAVAERAFQRFINPLHPTETADLFVVADGPLTYLPLEVLVPGPGEAPWSSTRRITYGPSAAVLLALRRPRTVAAPARALLAVGNPAVAPEADDSNPDATRRNELEPLPYSADEARGIAKLFERDGADALIGGTATLEHWLALDPGRYRFLHFAAHAVVSDRRTERTRLVLAGSGLDLPTIRELRLGAELVTLSACETALGRRVRGEGVVGLPYAFLAAGARGVVVTLWRVGDRSAADFMREFYAQVHAGRSPADALFTVRRAWAARHGPAGHPSEWAAFVLVGEGS